MFLQHTSCSSLVTRNLQSVINYSTLSNEQPKNMSLILSDNSAPPNTAHTDKTSQTVATAESSFTNSSVIPASGAFSGAVFHGGHFNITLNTLNKSPNTSKYSVSTVARSYKRIKRVLDPPAVPFQRQFFVKVFLIDSTIRCFWGHLMM